MEPLAQSGHLEVGATATATAVALDYFLQELMPAVSCQLAVVKPRAERERGVPHLKAVCTCTHAHTQTYTHSNNIACGPL